jgi:hypothetical protein
MSDIQPIPYEEHSMLVAREVMMEQIEAHPDFDGLNPDQQERVREWGLIFAYAGLQEGLRLRRQKARPTWVVLDAAADFLDDTASLTDAKELTQ